ncbi:MAG: hypothetical protein IKX59_11205 [Bacteroidales bacterium]|nr:hypothetical protein [Bacteroidales bacterium]
MENETTLEKRSAPQLKQVELCDDGKYRWVYEFDMLRNPSMIILVLKVFAYIIMGIGVFIFILGLFDGTDFLETLQFAGKIVLIIGGVFFVLSIVSYLILAALFNWKYVVLFEMDEEGIECRQLKKQVKKTTAIGFITAMVGLATGKPSTIGAGLLAATKTSSYSTFASVRAVKPYRRRHLIKVNEPLFFNQVYVDEDFDFVYDYIRSHCPKVRS